MVIAFLGLDLLFWVALALTVVFFLDLATCWWATGLRICPLRRWRPWLIRWHKYTRILLIALVVVHILFHLMWQVWGIVI